MKGLLGMALSLCMAVMLLPDKAHAEGPTAYNLWVGGVQVTSDNESSITGDGITGTVSYSSGTLYLSNASITGPAACKGAGIYYNGTASLCIALEGKNTITGTQASDGSSYGIYVGSETQLSFALHSGDGALKVTAADCSDDPAQSTSSVGIYTNGKISMDGCTLEAECGTAWTSQAIRCGGDGIEFSSTKLIMAKNAIGQWVLPPEPAAGGTLRADALSSYSYLKTNGGNISLEPQVIKLSDAYERYQAVTVKNTASFSIVGPLTASLAGEAAQYLKIVDDGGLAGEIPANGTATFGITFKDEGEVSSFPEVGTHPCTVTVTHGDSGVSASAGVNVTFYPETPSLENSELADATYKKGETARPLKIQAFVPEGTSDWMKYQWCRGSKEVYTELEGETNATFIPPTTQVGTETYFCRVLNYKDPLFSSTTSPVATITVTEDGETAGNEEASGTSDDSDTSQDSGEAYQIIEGSGGSFRAGSNTGYTIRGNGEFSRFTGIRVDGNLLEQSQYTAKEGSTIVTLQPSYLNTLAAGAHTAEIVWTDGTAATTFTVSTKDSVPKTGDETPLAGVWLLAGIAGLCLFLVGKSAEKRITK